MLDEAGHGRKINKKICPGGSRQISLIKVFYNHIV
jgi:hypothetical protein